MWLAGCDVSRVSVVGRYVDVCALGVGCLGPVGKSQSLCTRAIWDKTVLSAAIWLLPPPAVCPILAARPTQMAATTTTGGDGDGGGGKGGFGGVKTLPTASILRRSPRPRFRSAPTTSSRPRRAPSSAAGTGATRGAALARRPRRTSPVSSSEREHQPGSFPLSWGPCRGDLVTCDW